jgi:L-fuculose-phosphate aldolase
VDTINLIRSEAMGAGVARALGPHRAVLLKNHGAVTVGSTIGETVVGMIMLENAAQIQMIAEAAGETRPLFADADIEKLQHDISRVDQFDINFDYLVRRARRKWA